MLGVMLVGIVAMQVEELKLGASVGRALSETATLQSRNQLLRASVSALSDDQRIERLAARMGMVMPAPGDVVYLTPHTSADANRAANQIQPANPSAFLASLPQAAAGTTTGSTGLGTVAGTALAPAGTTASTTVTTTTTPAAGATTPTGAGGPTGVAAGATGTTGTTSSTGATGATAAPGATAIAGATGTTGGVSVAPVVTSNGGTGG